MKKSAMKVLGFTLVLLMLPFFAASFCPCTQAAPAASAEFQKIPCHGCCSENVVSKSGCEKTSEVRAADFRIAEIFNTGLGLHKAGPVLADQVPADVSPPAWNVSPGLSYVSTEPLFLSLQNLRI